MGSQASQSIRAGGGGRIEAGEDYLRDPSTPAALFDAAEAAFEPIEILINNPIGWVRKDTLASAGYHGRAANTCLWTVRRRFWRWTSVGPPEEVSDGAAKAGLVNYAMSAALELGDAAVRVFPYCTA